MVLAWTEVNDLNTARQDGLWEMSGIPYQQEYVYGGNKTTTPSPAIADSETQKLGMVQVGQKEMI